MVRRLKNLRAEEGMTLIELLIAMAVMSIGIAALVAGFSSGIVSITRANVTSTAGTLADKQMESFRQGPFATVQSKPAAPIDGPDGHRYSIQSDVSLCSASMGTACQLLRYPCEPSRQARDDRGARRGDREAPLHRKHDLRLLDRLTTHSK